MNNNTLRRLNWLWKHRHTHDDDVATEQLSVIVSEVQQQVDSAASGESGAYIHLLRAASQSIDAGGEAIAFDHLGLLGYAGFGPPPGVADDGTSGGALSPSDEIVLPLTGYWDVKLAAGWDTYDQGGSVWITRTRGGAESTVYPPVGMPDGLWTADNGQVGEWTAKAIPCVAGDVLKVYIDSDESTAQDLATAVVSVEMVDRARNRGGYRELILLDGPLAFWRLGESSGTTAIDETGNGYDGTYVDSPTLGADPVITEYWDASVDLDGTNHYVNVDPVVAGLDSEGDISIEAWVNLDALTATLFAVNTSGGGNRYVLGTIAGGYVRWTEGVSNWDSGAGELTADTPHHIVATRTAAGALIFYVDGTAIHSVTAGTGTATGGDTAQIGMDYDGGSETDLLDGQIDEVAVWTRVLTPVEVQQHYAKGTA